MSLHLNTHTFLHNIHEKDFCIQIEPCIDLLQILGIKSLFSKRLGSILTNVFSIKKYCFVIVVLSIPYLPLSCRFSKSSMVQIWQLFTLVYLILRIRTAYYFTPFRNMDKGSKKEKQNNENFVLKRLKNTKHKNFSKGRNPPCSWWHVPRALPPVI